MKELLFRKQVTDFVPRCIREERDKEIILRTIDACPDTILTRENPVCHLTASGFLMNEGLTRVLMVHHNLYRTWAWTGGMQTGMGICCGWQEKKPWRKPG